MIPNVPLPEPPEGMTACACVITWASPTPRPVCSVHGIQHDYRITVEDLMGVRWALGEYYATPEVQ